MRIAIVTNIPAPYRVPVYNLIASSEGVELHVFYAAQMEPDRSWDMAPLTHPHTFLPARMSVRNERFIHNQPQVYQMLGDFQPDVLITTGFNPTHLYAFAWAWLHQRRHVAMSDGTLASERAMSKLHRVVRRFVFARTQAFVAASNGGRALFSSYGIANEHIHFSPLCANTGVNWRAEGRTPADIDLLFSGRLVPPKNPLFALHVAEATARALRRRVSIAFLGNGPLEETIRASAKEMQDAVEAHFAGHLSQADLPHWFYRARLFLFPTSGDVWGVVANEACMAGLPVIVSPQAGAAGELVREGVNGHVMPLDVAAWTRAAVALLSSPERYRRMSEQARRAVLPYSFERAAQGILDAARQALKPRML